VLSGALLLEHLGWKEAADRIHRAVERVIAQRTVTVDLATQMPGAQQVGCAAFGERLLAALEA
jgi:isocitrate dehydrogenase